MSVFTVTEVESLPLPPGAATSAGVSQVRDRLPAALGRNPESASLSVAVDTGALAAMQTPRVVGRTRSDYIDCSAIDDSPWALPSSDIVVTRLHSGRIGSSDGVAYGTSATVAVPMSDSGAGELSSLGSVHRGPFGSLTVGLMTGKDAAAHNQDVLLSVQLASLGYTLATVATLTFKASQRIRMMIGPEAVAASGGVDAVGTAADFGYLSVPAMRGAPTIILVFTFPGATPTAGELDRIYVHRSA